MGQMGRNRRAGPEHDAGADAVAHQERRGLARLGGFRRALARGRRRASPRASAMTRRRAADSAGRSSLSTARWRWRGSVAGASPQPRETRPAPAAMATSAATMPFSASRCFSIAAFQSIALSLRSWSGIMANSTGDAVAAFPICVLLAAKRRLSAIRPRESFAYRFSKGESLKIFEPARGYHQWLAYLSEFGGPDNPFAEDRPAIVTDISDFYQRIYFHRIENVLQDAGCPKHPSDLLKKIIKTTRARQSYGLPVGSTASRMLAECLLNDTDMFLKNMGVKFTRFVDDFRIEIPSGMEAHSILCRLAEHLMVTEGLSLNVAKTRMTSVKEIRRSSKTRLQDVFTSAEMEKVHAFITLSYGEDDESQDEDIVTNPFLSAEILLEKLDEIGEKGRPFDLQGDPSGTSVLAGYRCRPAAR